jgi:hypothetical protein
MQGALRASEPTRIAVQAGDHTQPSDPRFMLASVKKKPKATLTPAPLPQGPEPEVRKNEQGLEIAGPGPEVTESFRKKTLLALETLNPYVAQWWRAQSVAGILRSRAGYWFQPGYRSEMGPNDRPVVTVDQTYTAGQAAQAIIAEAEGGFFANSIGVFYKKHRVARSKDVQEFRKWQAESVAEAGRQASVLAEMYVNGLATLTPSGDLVVTIDDLRERGLQWDQLLSLLPLLEKLTMVLAIVLPIAGRKLKIKKKYFRDFHLMLPEEQSRIVKSVTTARSDTEAKSIFEAEMKRAINTRQVHHAISADVHAALERHPILKGKYKLRDERFELLASSPEAHIGWEEWHRKLDKKIADEIRDHPRWTEREFEKWLREQYNQPNLKWRFLKGLD